MPAEFERFGGPLPLGGGVGIAQGDRLIGSLVRHRPAVADEVEVFAVLVVTAHRALPWLVAARRVRLAAASSHGVPVPRHPARAVRFGLARSRAIMALAAAPCGWRMMPPPAVSVRRGWRCLSAAWPRAARSSSVSRSRHSARSCGMVASFRLRSRVSAPSLSLARGSVMPRFSATRLMWSFGRRNARSCPG